MERHAGNCLILTHTAMGPSRSVSTAYSDIQIGSFSPGSLQAVVFSVIFHLKSFSWRWRGIEPGTFHMPRRCSITDLL